MRDTDQVHQVHLESMVTTDPRSEIEQKVVRLKSYFPVPGMHQCLLHAGLKGRLGTQTKPSSLDRTMFAKLSLPMCVTPQLYIRQALFSR